MVAFRLRFALAQRYVHPIGVCICGILSNLIAIAKLFRDKKEVMQFRKVPLMARNDAAVVLKYAADGKVEVLEGDPEVPPEDFEQMMDDIDINNRINYDKQSSDNLSIDSEDVDQHDYGNMSVE